MQFLPSKSTMTAVVWTLGVIWAVNTFKVLKPIRDILEG